MLRWVGGPSIRVSRVLEKALCPLQRIATADPWLLVADLAGVEDTLRFDQEDVVAIRVEIPQAEVRRELDYLSIYVVWWTQQSCWLLIGPRVK